VVECLASMREALGSISTTAKKKKKYLRDVDNADRG
jgi:hypothetical protein